MSTFALPFFARRLERPPPRVLRQSISRAVFIFLGIGEKLKKNDQLSF